MKRNLFVKANDWQKVQKHGKYRFHAMLHDFDVIRGDIQEQMFDGCVIKLSGKKNDKAYVCKKRIMRRRVEKLVGQAVHKHIGRTRGSYARHQMERFTSEMICKLNAYQHCC